MQLLGELAVSFFSLLHNNEGLNSISRGRIQLYILLLPPSVQVFAITELDRTGFSIMRVDTITLQLPDSSDSILFHEDLVKLENKLENWFPAATFLLQLKQRQQNPGETSLPAPSLLQPHELTTRAEYTARQEQADVIDRFLDRLALLFANTKKHHKTPGNVTATGLTRDTEAKCWNVYIAKNNGPQGEDTKFAERLQKWLNRSDDEESDAGENNECWKALLKFWNERIDFYRRKAPSWDSIEPHKVEITRYFEETDKFFDSDKFNEEWGEVAELLPRISDEAWPEYYRFWQRSTRQSNPLTARQGCPVWVENYCTCIHYLEMLAMPRSTWKAMVEFRERKAKISVKITLIEQLKFPKLDKDAIATALQAMNEKIDTRETQIKLKDSKAPKVYLHCEIQIRLLFDQLKNNANLKMHKFIGCSKLSCHMCWVVLEKSKYRTRGTHSKISANWSFQIPSSLEGIIEAFTTLHSKWQKLFRQYPDCDFPSWAKQKDTDPAPTQRFDLKPVGCKFPCFTIRKVALQSTLFLRLLSQSHLDFRMS